jgi:TPR repeat protein
MGILASSGLGMPRDAPGALGWFRLAAAQGEAYSQFALARFHEEGTGVPRDLESAAKLYRASAEENYAPSMHNLGHMYRKGEGVKKDPAEALRWYRLGAEHGNARCQYQIGWMHMEEEGVPRNLEEARKWLLLAAAQGDPAAQVRLGIMHRDGTTREVDPEAAFRWFTLATYDGRNLAKRENFNYALDEQEKAAKRLSSSQRGQALRSLGRVCMAGDGVPPSDMAALLFFTLSQREESLPSGREEEKRALDALRSRMTPWEMAQVEDRLKRWPSL